MDNATIGNPAAGNAPAGNQRVVSGPRVAREVAAPPPCGLRWFYLGTGWLAVALGVIGIAVPLLPTTPFLLVAAWAFAKASPALDRWLHEHPRFGPFLSNWRSHGTIPRRAKLAALGGMSVSWLIILETTSSTVAPIASGITLLCVAVYVVSRPSEPGRVPAE